MLYEKTSTFFKSKLSLISWYKNITAQANDELKPLLIKPQSDKIVDKCKTPKTETFLSRTKQDKS